MISTRFVKLAVSGLALGMSLTGGHPVTSTKSATSPEAKQLEVAAAAAAKASVALAGQKWRSAVMSAETAVEYAPRDANYRMLLGQAYLSAGRFSSAETSFSDALTLMPDNGRAGLNLALTQIAQGKRDAALSTLADYRGKLAAADYGLAIALSGDVETAVRTLESAIRDDGADAKTRQNLALAYAMAGKWANARVMAGQDLSPSEVDARLTQWASFVRPGSSYDQVASLLGVKPAEDAGQPTRLALNGFADTAVAAAEPVEAPMPAPAYEPPIAAVAIAEAPVAAYETPAVVAAAPSGIIMGERREIVQPLPDYVRPAPVIRAATNAVKQVIVPRAKPAPVITGAVVQPRPVRSVQAGKFVVQLGAFENAAVSRNSWSRLAPRYGLMGFDPANSIAKVSGASFVRLSVGGFATRAEANGICTRVRNAGGTCFVRGLLGDAPAQWVQRGLPKYAKPIRVASR
jgi:Flp pilus assembly protein TadD